MNISSELYPHVIAVQIAREILATPIGWPSASLETLHAALRSYLFIVAQLCEPSTQARLAPEDFPWCHRRRRTTKRLTKPISQRELPDDALVRLSSWEPSGRFHTACMPPVGCTIGRSLTKRLADAALDSGGCDNPYAPALSPSPRRLRPRPA